MAAIAKKLMLWLLAAFAAPAIASTSCDFKGVSVGDKATPESVMASFGVKSYKTHPEKWQFEKSMQLARKIGLMAAAEAENWEIGPACESDSCRIPFGVGVGNNNTPVSVFVSLREGRITEIDVNFSESDWAEIRPILDKKYGANWSTERDPEFLITDLETKKSSTVERVTLTHSTNGKNSKTGDSCQLWATNFDMVFQHHDSLGAYHSLFAIKLVSGNF